MIPAVLLGLVLVLFSRRREFFSGVSANPLYWTDAEVQTVRSIYPEFTTKLENAVKTRYILPIEPDRLANFTNRELKYQTNFAKDALAGKPPTRENIAAYVQGITYPFMIPLKSELTEFLVRYFEVDKPASSTANAKPVVKHPGGVPGKEGLTEEEYNALKARLPNEFSKIEQQIRNEPRDVPLTEEMIQKYTRLSALSNAARIWNILYDPATSRLTTGDIDLAFRLFKKIDQDDAVRRGSAIGMIDDSFYQPSKAIAYAYFDAEPGPPRNPFRSDFADMVAALPPETATPAPAAPSAIAAPAAAPTTTSSPAPATAPATAPAPTTAPVPASATTSSPAPSETAVQGTVVTSIASLEQKYNNLKSDYESVVNDALGTTKKEDLQPLVSKILELNVKLTETLGQLVDALAVEEAKGNTDFTAKRNDFALRLSQIKKDYGDLKSDTDKMTTLRRIREFEEKKADSGLKGYLIAFGVAVSLLIVLILFKMFQPSKNLYAANPMPASPAISTDLNM